MLTLVLGLPARLPATAGPQEAVELMQQGISKIQDGNVEDGLLDLQKAIEIEPQQAQAHFFAGQASAQLQRWQAAYDYFVAAADLVPGYGEAHLQACRVAYALEKFDESWEQAILASQAGIDMESAFAGLVARAPAPDDLRQRLAAPRVLIGNIDTEAVGSQDMMPGSSGVGSGSPAFLVEMEADLQEVRRQFGRELQRSTAFGVVSQVDTSTHILVIKVDSIDSRSLRGFVKLIDTATQKEVYSRVLVLNNIRSVADVRNDVGRYVGFMEVWARERGR